MGAPKNATECNDHGYANLYDESWAQHVRVLFCLF